MSLLRRFWSLLVEAWAEPSPSSEAFVLRATAAAGF